MSDYLTTLKLADDLFEGLLSGDKRVTIRMGQRNIQVGADLTIEATDGTQSNVVVTIEGLTILPVNLIDDEYLAADGFDSYEDFIQGMKRFYPTITEDSIVSIIFFTIK